MGVTLLSTTGWELIFVRCGFECGEKCVAEIGLMPRWADSSPIDWERCIFRETIPWKSIRRRSYTSIHSKAKESWYRNCQTKWVTLAAVCTVAINDNRPIFLTTFSINRYMFSTTHTFFAGEKVYLFIVTNFLESLNQCQKYVGWTNKHELWETHPSRHFSTRLHIQERPIIYYFLLFLAHAPCLLPYFLLFCLSNFVKRAAKRIYNSVLKYPLQI